MKIATDERCIEYSAPGHPARPQRVKLTLEKLRAQTELTIDWRKPADVPDAVILRAHTREHFDRVRSPAGDFDGDTPAYPGIFEHARRSVGGALEAMKQA